MRKKHNGETWPKKACFDGDPVDWSDLKNPLPESGWWWDVGYEGHLGILPTEDGLGRVEFWDYIYMNKPETHPLEDLRKAVEIAEETAAVVRRAYETVKDSKPRKA